QDLPAGALTVVGEAALGFAIGTGDKLFLYSPGKTAALDGVLLQAEHQGRLPQGTGRWRLPRRPTPGAPNEFQFHDEVVINEVMYHHRTVLNAGNLVDSPESWVELYNRSASTVDLTGWKLDGGIHYLFEDHTMLGPDQYLVVAADKATLAAQYPAIRIVGDFT